MANALRPIPAKVKPINVRVFELPEFIFVQTKLITPRYALENRILTTRLKKPWARTKSAILAPAAKVERPPPKIVPLPSRTGPQKTPETSYPVRERAIQTEEKQTCDVGVQCDTEEWEETQMDTERKGELSSGEEDEESKFITFVGENTLIIRNGMMECLVCGEVARSLEHHKSHIVTHYGPKVLCCLCGEFVDHERLLLGHNLTCRSRPSKKPSIFLKCPNMFCNVVCRTQPQLYKHLSTHDKGPFYRCLECRLHFRTAMSFLLHRKKKEDCNRAKALFLFDKHSASRLKGNLKRCTVCLRKFNDERLCGIHRFNCIQAHHKKLTKKLFKPSSLA
ncbi:DNA-binding protein Ikaros [Drosophila pseudoobscura]|uniref:DNA-binding protein Ikaros n=1 Tax=Drosophila pseudoobscura pseudoobscura TaxID=46245 RepID=A0A6I8UMT2_DROPS|nr:DNA-binding protein Ikaros [Drosophila pseudoobscura]